MCNRFVISSPADSVAKWFGTRNATPTRARATTLLQHRVFSPCATTLRLASAPLTRCAGGWFRNWAKDIKIGYSLINGKAETVAEKPAFRDAFKSRRCLIPTDGFYE
jgi:putative SOS response-associated peptidase YedK